MQHTNKEMFSKSDMIKCIIQTYQKLDSELRKFLKPYGITLQQYNVLKILRGAKKPLSTSIIRERMIEPMTDTSRLVERLCTKGLVDRSACEADKRLVDITISPEGISFIDNMDSTDKVIDKLYEHINLDEANRLNYLLNKLRG